MKKAFSLIELLVVVAIIAILVAILLPSLSMARQYARSTDCRSNMRQMMLAVQMYNGEWNDSYPPAWIIGNATTPTIAWCGQYYTIGTDKYMDVTYSPLWKYLQTKQSLMCNSFDNYNAKYVGSGAISGYGINCQYVAGDPKIDPLDKTGMKSYAMPAKTGQIQNPANTIIFADAAKFVSQALTEEIFIYPVYKSNGAINKSGNFNFRHNGKTANIAFCDGHIEAVGKPFKPDPTGDGSVGWMSNDMMDRE